MHTVLRIVRMLHLNSIMRMPRSTHQLTEYFRGLEKVDAVRSIFGDETERTLSKLKVEFTWFAGYMSVNGSNGHILISTKYLNNGDRMDIYLDLIHELVHVRQFMEGRELFDLHYSYAERPTEVEAYRHAVEEARRLGLNDARICQYLKTEWMSHQDLRRLANALGVNCGQHARPISTG